MCKIIEFALQPFLEMLNALGLSQLVNKRKHHCSLEDLKPPLLRTFSSQELLTSLTSQKVEGIAPIHITLALDAQDCC